MKKPQIEIDTEMWDYHERATREIVAMANASLTYGILLVIALLLKQAWMVWTVAALLLLTGLLQKLSRALWKKRLLDEDLNLLKGKK